MEIIGLDSCFKPGFSHGVCQDYACVKRADDYCVALVSDGCSRSVGSDFGARLIAQAAIQRCEVLVDWTRGVLPAGDFADRVIHLASEWSDTMGLPRRGLDATLVATCYHAGMIGVLAAGDGHYVTVHHDNSFAVHVLSYTEPYPRYLTYQIDASAREQRDAAGIRYTLTVHNYDANGELTETTSQALDDGLYTVILPQSMVRAIIVGSDGLDTLMRFENPQIHKEPKELPSRETYAELFGFKNFQGEFIRRRMNRFLVDALKLGRAFSDDVSLAGIAFREGAPE